MEKKKKGKGCEGKGKKIIAIKRKVEGYILAQERKHFLQAKQNKYCFLLCNIWYLKYYRIIYKWG